MRITQSGWIRTEGGWCRAVIDLSWPASFAVVVWHSDDPAFPADGICARERLEVPHGHEIDIRCPDCASEVVQFGGELAAVAAQRLGADAVAGVAHSASCPWLARTLKGARS